MKSAFRAGLSIVLLGSALLVLGFARPAAAGGFEGTWACSSSLDNSPLGGSITSLLRLTIIDGLAFGSGIAAVEINGGEFVAENTSGGEVTELPGGFLEITSQITTGGVTVDTRIRCLGMTAQGGAFNEMHCIDLTQEPAGESQVSLAICKRQYPVEDGLRGLFLNGLAR